MLPLRPPAACVVVLPLVDFSCLAEASVHETSGFCFEPLPNLGTTCWLASVIQLLRTCDLRLPYDGNQQDPRDFLAAICAMFPQRAHDHLWSFNRNASCSSCNSCRPLPCDDQFVVDLALASDQPTCLSDLVAAVSSPAEALLDCEACGGVSRLLDSPAPAAHHPFVLFHLRHAVDGIKSRSVVHVPTRVFWFGRTYQLAGATIHIAEAPNAGHYITVLPPQGWTCVE